MADKVVNKKTLAAVSEYVDGDTRTLTWDSPNTAINLKAALIALEAKIKAKNILLGDKAGADFLRLNPLVKLTIATDTSLDLG